MPEFRSKWSIRKPGWMNRRLILLLITLLVLTISIGWGESSNRNYDCQTCTEDQTPEYLAFVEIHQDFQNGQISLAEFKFFDQTNRVIIGGVIVILIIISTVLYGYFYNQ